MEFYFLIAGICVLGGIYSTYCYEQGFSRGKAEGMIDITEFYQQKKAFKDKQNILGFENWPNWIQFIIENDGLEIKIVDAKKKD